MLTRDDVQRIALSLPGTTLDPHWGVMTFRRQRTYAVVHEDGQVLLRLSLRDQAALVGDRPDLFAPFMGRGPQGLTSVQLTEVDAETLEAALRTAWENSGAAR